MPLVLAKHIQRIVIQHLTSKGNFCLQQLARDNCSEMCRLVGIWIQNNYTRTRVHIIKGTTVCNTENSHDLVVITMKKQLILLDPTIWQFFPHKHTILIGTAPNMKEVLQYATNVYGGTWIVSETFNKRRYTEESLLKVIYSNISFLPPTT